MSEFTASYDSNYQSRIWIMFVLYTWLSLHGGVGIAKRFIDVWFDLNWPEPSIDPTGLKSYADPFPGTPWARV